MGGGERLVGAVLVVGFLAFMVGAGAWRLEFQSDLPDALVAIHRRRRRWQWITTWISVGTIVTTAGVIPLALLAAPGNRRAAALAAAVVFTLGAALWLVSLAARVSVQTWASDVLHRTGAVPEAAHPLGEWAGVLYTAHMLAAYAATAAFGAALTSGAPLAGWIGWAGLGYGAALGIGFVLLRGGPFSPPFLAVLWPGVAGVGLLLH